ncbi:MAG: hypothetical protein HY078_15300 [Elusimicrobia bacterium]|nr:hypothetical protein [Elusimicrobiota bacterium]
MRISKARLLLAFGVGIVAWGAPAPAADINETIRPDWYRRIGRPLALEKDRRTLATVQVAEGVYFVEPLQQAAVQTAVHKGVLMRNNVNDTWQYRGEIYGPKDEGELSYEDPALKRHPPIRSLGIKSQLTGLRPSPHLAITLGEPTTDAGKAVANSARTRRVLEGHRLPLDRIFIEISRFNVDPNRRSAMSIIADERTGAVNVNLEIALPEGGISQRRFVFQGENVCDRSPAFGGACRKLGRFEPNSGDEES